MVFSFDEINKIYDGKYKRKSIPYEQYFGEMDLSTEQEEERISFAKRFEELMMFLFFLLNAYEEYGDVEESIDFIIYTIKQRYKDIVIDYMALEEYIEEYIDEFVQDIVETTLKHKYEPYYTSEDRAVLTSENEANTILNYKDFIDAIQQGFTKKIWNTERDGNVRATHVPLEGKVLDISIPYVVGDSLMLFPKDTSYGASQKEIANCRCTITYLKWGFNYGRTKNNILPCVS